MSTAKTAKKPAAKKPAAKKPAAKRYAGRSWLIKNVLIGETGTGKVSISIKLPVEYLIELLEYQNFKYGTMNLPGSGRSQRKRRKQTK